MNKQLDLFITLTANEASIKSNQDLMSRSWVDLSKNHKRKLIQHTAKDGSWVKIHANEDYGLATIADMDVLLFITSAIMDKVNNGESLTNELRFTGYEYFHFTNKSKSGRSDKRLQEALTRLHTTRIETNIRSEDKKEKYSSFYWISEWQKVVDNGRTVGYSVKLQNWMLESISTPKLILTLDDEYFQISSGLKKWLYLFCRKAVGLKSRTAWKESFRSIHEKSGMNSSLKSFTFTLRKIISKNDIPNYYLEENENNILSITRTRKTLHKSRASLDEQQYIEMGSI